jgi:hypothetical protein
MQGELDQVIPSFVKRANDRYGRESQKFLSESRDAGAALGSTVLSSPEPQTPVTLVDYDTEIDAEVKIATAILFRHTQIPMKVIRQQVRAMGDEERRNIIHEYLYRRQNRRHRPGRAFENTSYTFDLLGNYGMYRDLQRHRMLTQEKQDLTVMNGYDTPAEIVDAGFADKYHAAMRAAAEAFLEISRRYPRQAQYVVPFGYRVRWYFNLNLRSAYHLLELRTMQQGHPDYRKMCQQMFLAIRQVHPFLSGYMRFVDMNEYRLERLESEKKLDQKIESMKQKYGP